MKKVSFYLLAAVLLLSSCKAYQKTVYLQNSGTPASYNDSASYQIPDPIIKTGDLLTISINSISPESSAPFNMNYGNSTANLSNSASSNQGYLVDVHGDIYFPVIGKIHALGLSKSQLSDYIKAHIYPAYIKVEPIVDIKYNNFKISVLGEVGKPGAIPVNGERINIMEAIAQAGDLTIYGKRNNILLIRETSDGKHQTIRIDIRDKRIIESPYYYLQQNDVLYVEPNGPKMRGQYLGSAEGTVLSIVTALVSLSSLIISVVR